MEAFNLSLYLDLEASAYGDDYADPVELGAIVQARAAERTRGHVRQRAHHRYRRHAEGHRGWVQALGCRGIAVASGQSNADELREAGATVVIPDLTDPARLAQLVSLP